METIGALLLLLLAARVSGLLMERIFLPSAVGEMLAGMVLISIAQFAGPFRPFIEGLPDNEALSHVADLGIFFLLLMAGVDMQLSDTVHDARKSFAVALGGVVLPLGAVSFWALHFSKMGRSGRHKRC